MMLVRKMKCTVCGANKVNENKSLYIYCDYCSSWMGLDLLESTKETSEALNYQNMNDANATEYRELTMKLGEVMASKDKQSFIELQLKIHKLEFELFPERHGPKGKQPTYKNKYLEFYKEYYNEVVDDSYFDKYSSSNLGELVSKLKFSMEGGKVKYEFNEDFISYIDENVKIINAGYDENRNLQCLSYHPEQVVLTNRKLMQQIAINAFLQVFCKENSEQIIEHLNLKHEYIEIPDVVFSEINCRVCEEKLNVPEGSKSILCESCGCINNVKTQNIQCLNCSAEFNPMDEEKCPYCGGKVEFHKSVGDVISEKYQQSDSSLNNSPENPNNSETIEQSPKKGGFFSKLFGN